MKKLLLVALCALSLNALAWNQRPPEPVQNCAIHSPWGWPVSVPAVQPICREAYLVGYDAPVKIPKYVTYTLTSTASVNTGWVSFTATIGNIVTAPECHVNISNKKDQILIARKDV